MEQWDFRLLGPFEVLRNGEAARAGGPLECVVLALLAVEGGRAVAVERLIDGMWGDEAPATARKTLQTYVSHLRRALPGLPLRTVGAGYELDAPPEAVDAQRFESLARQAREAMDAGRAEVASLLFGDALALWRGPALGGLPERPALLAEAARLEEVRVRAVEGRIEAGLALGRHSDLVAELQDLARRYPLREPFWAQLMLALYRSGRQAEALAAYRQARAALVEELGIEPASALRRLEQRILEQDPELDWRPREVSPPPAAAGGRAPQPSADRLLDEGRTAFAECDWARAYGRLSELQAAHGLDPEDDERMGEAAWWLGLGEESISARERAYAAYMERGDRRAAARVATMLAEHHFERQSIAVGQGWIGRADRLLQGDEPSPELGLLSRLRTVVAFDMAGDATAALPIAEQTAAIGVACGDREVEVYGLQDQGRIMVTLGRVAEGMRLMDEAMAAAVGSELGPFATGVIYCNTVLTCTSLGDYRRAAEWTEAMKRWSERHARSGFPGVCRVLQAEVLRLRGLWAEAQEAAHRAQLELREVVPAFVGDALYEVAEVHRLRGDLETAERLFGEAHAHGRDPCPGLALIRLALGDARGALSTIEHGLAERALPMERMRLLPAAVEIAFAADEPEIARRVLDEMRELAARYETPAMRAAEAHAAARAHLAEGDAAGAIRELVRARRLWQEAAVPYEAARAQALSATAYRHDGDEGQARLQMAAARAAFERLGATLDLRAAELFLAPEQLARPEPAGGAR